jgi:hypothetical protein
MSSGREEWKKVRVLREPLVDVVNRHGLRLDEERIKNIRYGSTELSVHSGPFDHDRRT